MQSHHIKPQMSIAVSKLPFDWPLVDSGKPVFNRAPPWGAHICPQLFLTTICWVQTYSFIKAHCHEILPLFRSSIAGKQIIGMKYSLSCVVMMGGGSKEMKVLESVEYALTFRDSAWMNKWMNSLLSMLCLLLLSRTACCLCMRQSQIWWFPLRGKKFWE